MAHTTGLVSPPRPVIASGGRRLVAAPGSFCYQVPGGGCGDTDTPRTKRGLPVRRGTLVTVTFRIPVRTVRVGLLTDSGTRPYIRRIIRHGRDGRLWSFRVPRAPTGPKDLVLSVGFPRDVGDAAFGFKLLPPR